MSTYTLWMELWPFEGRVYTSIFNSFLNNDFKKEPDHCEAQRKAIRADNAK